MKHHVWLGFVLRFGKTSWTRIWVWTVQIFKVFPALCPSGHGLGFGFGQSKFWKVFPALSPKGHTDYRIGECDGENWDDVRLSVEWHGHLTLLFSCVFNAGSVWNKCQIYYVLDCRTNDFCSWHCQVQRWAGWLRGAEGFSHHFSLPMPGVKWVPAPPSRVKTIKMIRFRQGKPDIICGWKTQRVTSPISEFTASWVW